MHVMDVLIFNTDRNETNLLYTPGNWKLWLIDHSRAFRNQRRRPDTLEGVAIDIPAGGLVERLRDLEATALQQKMEGLLSRLQIKMLLARRDLLLEAWKEQEAAASGG